MHKGFDMHWRSNVDSAISMLETAGRRLCLFLSLGMLCIVAAYATEGGTSVYPAGVETIMPGRMIGPGDSMLLVFNNFYEANELVGTSGRALVPGFHLRVGAVAFKFVHNWGVHLLGGTLVNTVAVPIVDIHLNAPFGSQNKAGFGNPDLETAISYNTGALHWWYGMEVYTLGFSYNKTDLVNIDAERNQASRDRWQRLLLQADHQRFAERVDVSGWKSWARPGLRPGNPLSLQSLLHDPEIPKGLPGPEPNRRQRAVAATRLSPRPSARVTSSNRRG